jgi:hypothetical protein
VLFRSIEVHKTGTQMKEIGNRIVKVE